MRDEVYYFVAVALTCADCDEDLLAEHILDMMTCHDKRSGDIVYFLRPQLVRKGDERVLSAIDGCAAGGNSLYRTVILDGDEDGRVWTEIPCDKPFRRPLLKQAIQALVSVRFRDGAAHEFSRRRSLFRTLHRQCQKFRENSPDRNFISVHDLPFTSTTYKSRGVEQMRHGGRDRLTRSATDLELAHDTNSLRDCVAGWKRDWPRCFVTELLSLCVGFIPAACWSRMLDEQMIVMNSILHDAELLLFFALAMAGVDAAAVFERMSDIRTHRRACHLLIGQQSLGANAVAAASSASPSSAEMEEVRVPPLLMMWLFKSCCRFRCGAANTCDRCRHDACARNNITNLLTKCDRCAQLYERANAEERASVAASKRQVFGARDDSTPAREFDSRMSSALSGLYLSLEMFRFSDLHALAVALACDDDDGQNFARPAVLHCRPTPLRSNVPRRSVKETRPARVLLLPEGADFESAYDALHAKCMLDVCRERVSYWQYATHHAQPSSVNAHDLYYGIAHGAAAMCNTPFEKSVRMYNTALHETVVADGSTAMPHAVVFRTRATRDGSTRPGVLFTSFDAFCLYAFLMPMARYIVSPAAARAQDMSGYHCLSVCTELAKAVSCEPHRSRVATYSAHCAVICLCALLRVTPPRANESSHACERALVVGVLLNRYLCSIGPMQVPPDLELTAAMLCENRDTAVLSFLRNTFHAFSRPETLVIGRNACEYTYERIKSAALNEEFPGLRQILSFVLHETDDAAAVSSAGTTVTPFRRLPNAEDNRDYAAPRPTYVHGVDPTTSLAMLLAHGAAVGVTHDNDARNVVEALSVHDVEMRPSCNVRVRVRPDAMTAFRGNAALWETNARERIWITVFAILFYMCDRWDDDGDARRANDDDAARTVDAVDMHDVADFARMRSRKHAAEMLTAVRFGELVNDERSREDRSSSSSDACDTDLREWYYPPNAKRTTTAARALQRGCVVLPRVPRVPTSRRASASTAVVRDARLEHVSDDACVAIPKKIV